MTTSQPTLSRQTTSLLFAALLALAACRVEESASHETVVKAPAAPAAMPSMPPMPSGEATGLPPGHPPMGGAAPAAAPAGGMPGMVGDVPPPPPVADGSGLKWTLPKGWTDTRPGGMRYATLKPADGKIEISVIVLGGQAGGELANVNRWRGQIGLAPIEPGALASVRKAVPTKAGEVGVFDFTSEGETKTRLVAGLLSANGSTWFVKMTGEAQAVGAAKPEFDKILETLSF